MPNVVSVTVTFDDGTCQVLSPNVVAAPAPPVNDQEDKGDVNETPDTN